DQNLLPYTPVIKKAVQVLPQYLFPNRQITAFGDTYYSGLNTEAFSDMIRLARKYGNREDEVRFTQMYRLFEPRVERQDGRLPQLPIQVASFFTTKPLELDETVDKGKVADYVTPAFYAPNVSWFVQRSKFEDPQYGLMATLYGSYGNHAHAN